MMVEPTDNRINASKLEKKSLRWDLSNDVTNALNVFRTYFVLLIVANESTATPNNVSHSIL